MSRKTNAEKKIDLNIVRYSQCWEDPACLYEALNIGPDDDVLSITSGGCNTLALLLKGPRSVTALDFNPAQNHLLRLKVAAIGSLSYANFLELLGVVPSSKRVLLYEGLRDGLPEETRLFWDSHRVALERGILDMGRFDRYLGLFRRRILPRVHDRDTVREMLRPKTIEEQATFFHEVWDNRRWRMLFRFFFGRTLLGLLGRDPAFFRYVEEGSVGEAFLQRARHAFTEIPVDGNYFVEYILLGEFRDPDRAHPYLNMGNYLMLREYLPRLKIVTAGLGPYLLRQDEGSFSAFNLSDSFEWMSEEEYTRHLTAIVRSARDGVRLAYWNLLVPRSHGPSMNDVLELDEALSEWGTPAPVPAPPSPHPPGPCCQEGFQAGGTEVDDRSLRIRRPLKNARLQRSLHTVDVIVPPSLPIRSRAFCESSISISGASCPEVLAPQETSASSMRRSPGSPGWIEADIRSEGLLDCSRHLYRFWESPACPD